MEAPSAWSIQKSLIDLQYKWLHNWPIWSCMESLYHPFCTKKLWHEIHMSFLVSILLKLWGEFCSNSWILFARTYSSGPNKHVLTLIYSHKKIAPTFILSPKIRFDIFLKSCISPIKSEHNVPTTRLFRTALSFGPIKKPSSAFLPKNAENKKSF